ncbi:hypothetical protein M5K25_016863 [Dendrobium thyrsiflorum]|uniref:Uncharacterized protein n=1 Tax=Dendrobium thyrsiflorum TaxID=117978 RepID=A0ABD0USM9_DENTH
MKNMIMTQYLSFIKAKVDAITAPMRKSTWRLKLYEKLIFSIPLSPLQCPIHFTVVEEEGLLLLSLGLMLMEVDQ